MSVKYLTAFEAYYGPDTQMGRALTLAQEEQFLNEDMGVPITQQLLDSTPSQNDQNVYPHLFQHLRISPSIDSRKFKKLGKRYEQKFPCLAGRLREKCRKRPEVRPGLHSQE